MLREFLAATSVLIAAAGTGAAQQAEPQPQQRATQSPEAGGAVTGAGGSSQWRGEAGLLVDRLRGASVVDQEGEELGAVQDLRIDERGQLTAVVVEQAAAEPQPGAGQASDGRGTAAERPAREQVAEREPVDFIPAQEEGQILAGEVIGLSVMGGNGEEIGRIGDLILDASGQVAGTLLDVGGFLGIAQKQVAVPWRQINFSAVEQIAAIDVSGERLEAAPDFETIAEIRRGREAEPAQ